MEPLSRFRSVLPVARCFVEEGIIRRIESAQITIFDPFDSYYRASGKRKSLYLEFVSLDETKDAAIEKFVSKYGFLGSLIEPIGNGQESLESFKAELRRFRALVSLWAAYSSKDTNQLKKALQDIKALDEVAGYGLMIDSQYERESPYEDERDAGIFTQEWVYVDRDTSWEEDWFAKLMCDQGSLDNLLLDAEEYLSDGFFYSPLKDVRLVPIGGYGPGRSGLEPGWYCRTLLSAMYTMFYLDATGKATVRICQNETCQKPFVPSKPSKIYCDDKCLARQRQRNYRRRKAIEARSNRPEDDQNKATTR